jgi:hypothetical protein
MIEVRQPPPFPLTWFATQEDQEEAADIVVEFAHVAEQLQGSYNSDLEALGKANTPGFSTFYAQRGKIESQDGPLDAVPEQAALEAVRDVHEDFERLRVDNELSDAEWLLLSWYLIQSWFEFV